MENMKTRVFSVANIDSRLATGYIRDDHPLQRLSEQHTTTVRDNIIASAIADRYIPEVIICEQRIREGSDENWFWLIDGKQRWTELAMFRRNQIKLGKNIDEPIVTYRKIDPETHAVIHETFDIRGKRYSDLPQELREQYDSFEIQGRIFLDCTDADIELYIKKFNNFKLMTIAQKGITHIGTEYASIAKKMAAHDFFREVGRFTFKEGRSGAIERVIVESAMLINFPDAWVKSHEKLCDYMRENATVASFDKLEKYMDRLENVLSDGAYDEYFNCKNAAIYFALFDLFQKTGEPDERFADFLTALDGMTEISVDGDTLASVFDMVKGGTGSKWSTKDKTYIHKMLHVLEGLMSRYLGCQIKEKETVKHHEKKFDELVECLKASDISAFAEDPETVVGNYLSIRYQKDPDTSLQEFVESIVMPETEIEDFELCVAILENWTLEISNSNPVLQNGNIASLLAIVNYAVDADIDETAKEWFVRFTENVMASNARFGSDQAENYKNMRSRLECHVNFRKSA